MIKTWNLLAFINNRGVFFQHERKILVIYLFLFLLMSFSVSGIELFHKGTHGTKFGGKKVTVKYTMPISIGKILVS